MFIWVKSIGWYHSVQMTPSLRGQWKVFSRMWRSTQRGSIKSQVVFIWWHWLGFFWVSVCVSGESTQVSWPLCTGPTKQHHGSQPISETPDCRWADTPRGSQSELRSSRMEEQLCLVQVWCPPRSNAAGKACHRLGSVNVYVCGSHCQSP